MAFAATKKDETTPKKIPHMLTVEGPSKPPVKTIS